MKRLRKAMIALAFLQMQVSGPALANDASPSVPDDVKARIDAALDSGDYTTAAALLTPLAESGDRRSLVALGTMYWEGQGFIQDKSRALIYFERAADAGSWGAQYIVGMAYLNGQVYQRNERLAVRYLSLAAEQGSAEAQFALGAIFDPSVRGLQLDASLQNAKDPIEAAHWYKLAADQGFATAQFNLARQYEEGIGAPQNFREAARLYELAAKQGVSAAQNNLGVLYTNGQGVPKDPVKANMWYLIAAAFGDDRGLDNREITTGNLTSAQQSRSEVLANRCIDSQFQDCD